MATKKALLHLLFILFCTSLAANPFIHFKEERAKEIVEFLNQEKNLVLRQGFVREGEEVVPPIVIQSGRFDVRKETKPRSPKDKDLDAQHIIWFEGQSSRKAIMDQQISMVDLFVKRDKWGVSTAYLLKLPTFNESTKIGSYCIERFLWDDIPLVKAKPIAKETKKVVPARFSTQYTLPDSIFDRRFFLPDTLPSLSGTVEVRFTIKANGEICNVVLQKQLYPYVDEEVKRVVSSSPKWIPRYENDKAVDSDISLLVQIRPLKNGFEITTKTPPARYAEGANKWIEQLKSTVEKGIATPESFSSLVKEKPIVRFTINEEGKVIDPVLVKSVSEEWGEAYLQWVKNGGNWLTEELDGTKRTTNLTLLWGETTVPVDRIGGYRNRKVDSTPDSLLLLTESEATQALELLKTEKEILYYVNRMDFQKSEPPLLIKGMKFSIESIAGVDDRNRCIVMEWTSPKKETKREPICLVDLFIKQNKLAITLPKEMNMNRYNIYAENGNRYTEVLVWNSPKEYIDHRKRTPQSTDRIIPAGAGKNIYQMMSGYLTQHLSQVDFQGLTSLRAEVLLGKEGTFEEIKLSENRYGAVKLFLIEMLMKIPPIEPLEINGVKTDCRMNLDITVQSHSIIKRVTVRDAGIFVRKGNTGDVIRDLFTHTTQLSLKDNPILIRFVVDAKGKCSNFELSKATPSSSINQEVLNALDNIPIFVPRLKNGKPAPTLAKISFDQAYFPKIKPAQPKFPGGDSELARFLSTTVRYPQSMIDQRIEGTVVVRFFVEPDGSRSNIEVIEGMAPAFDQEAIRVANLLPKFIPGEGKNFQPIRTIYKLPIRFMPD